LFYEKDKKNVVGHVVVYLYFDGANKMANNDSSVRIVGFYLHAMQLNRVLQIILFGLRNGY
jgi:hypothetical protein